MVRLVCCALTVLCVTLQVVAPARWFQQSDLSPDAAPRFRATQLLKWDFGPGFARVAAAVAYLNLLQGRSRSSSPAATPSPLNGERFLPIESSRIEPLNLKSEFRSPKSERNPKPEGRTTQPVRNSRLRISEFGLLSGFGIRISGSGGGPGCTAIEISQEGRRPASEGRQLCSSETKRTPKLRRSDIGWSMPPLIRGLRCCGSVRFYKDSAPTEHRSPRKPFPYFNGSGAGVRGETMASACRAIS